MNPYILIAFLLALAGAGVGGFKLGVDHEVASQVTKEELVAEAVDAATSAAADAIAKLKVKTTTINSEVQHEIRTNTVYADCKLPDTGVRLVNAALDPSAAFSLGKGKLPTADSIKR